MKGEYKITATNRPDPWKFAKAWALIAGEKFGAEVTVTGVRRKDTGEAVPEGRARESA